MKQTKYYCDLCKEENKNFDEEWCVKFRLGKHFEALGDYAKELGYQDICLPCMKNVKAHFDKILPEQKK